MTKPGEVNDMLLTPEEMAEAKSAARRKSTTTTHAALAPVIDDAICRAQLRKVVEFMQEWAVGADTEATVLKDDIWIPGDDRDWAALKAAGGEG